MSKYTLGSSTTRNLESLFKANNPRSIILVNAVKEFINFTPIDFTIISNGGYRTVQMQKELFAKGVTKCDGVIHKSYHQSGLAVDLVPWVNNKATWDKISTFYLAGAFMSFCNVNNIKGITSGADWNSDGVLTDGWDPCHFQIK